MPAVWDTVVVTGGAGFIGSNVIEAILKQRLAKNIVCLDNYSSGSETNHFDGVTYARGDSWSIAEELSDIGDVDVVFHFAEFSRIVSSFGKIQYVWQSNSLGTQRVLDFCIAKKAKLIYSGSSSIFGNDMNDSNLSPYAFLKRQNIQLIENYREWFGLKYAIVYFYNVYGPRDLEDGEYATCVGKFRRLYAAGEPMTVVYPGLQRRVFTHVDDIVSGVLLVAQRGEGDGYKLASDDDVSIFDLVGLFGMHGRFQMIPERRGERFSSTVGESRARTELGWAPKVRLADYLSEFTAGVDRAKGTPKYRPKET